MREAFGPRLRLRVLRPERGLRGGRPQLGLARIAGGDDFGGGGLARNARGGPRARVADRADGSRVTPPVNLAATTNTLADDSYRVASQNWRDGNQRVLTSADRSLPDDFFARGSLLASNSHTSTANADVGERPLTSSEFVQRILRQPGAAGDPFYRSIF